MSSLQKFHRRTNGGAPAAWIPSAIGDGDETHGFWMGGMALNALIAAPKSTEFQNEEWGGRNYLLRGTTSVTDGIGNTNTLAGFGSSPTYGHPAAYKCKTLTTGGYNTWYLPAQNELNTLYSNKSATPFATGNYFNGYRNTYWSSTETSDNVNYAQQQNLSTGLIKGYYRNAINAARAVRRYVIPTPKIGDGDSTNGFWLGTAGDGVSKLIVAPKSTETLQTWGSYNITRNTVSTTNGLANTNTLYALGSAAHPAAYYCKTLTSGGYNTWYLPARNEVNTLYSNKSATPFATANSFVTSGADYWSSTENNAGSAWNMTLTNGMWNDNNGANKYGTMYVRAVRRVS
jgi:hypothetical protein